jgi:branched-chain amino acid transport system substrate-binding protein
MTGFLRFFLMATLLLAPLKPALAENEIAGNTIVLGQSAPFSGSLAALGTDYRDGANLYFEQVNSQGGVAGRKIKLVSFDDGYVVEKTVANTKKLIEEEHAFALFNMLGTPNILAIMPMVSNARVPLFSMLTGAEPLRSPFNRYLFHMRAGYVEETDKLVEQAKVFGIKKIAVAYQDNAFGKAGLGAAERAIGKHGMELVAATPINVDSMNVPDAVNQISKAKPQGVVVITAGKSSVDFISTYRQRDPTAWHFALSIVSSKELAKALGDQSRGIVVSQVVPYPWKDDIRVVREYQDLMQKAGKNKESYSYASLEGFISAKLFVEAIKRVGKDLTREKLIAVLESTGDVDAGGFRVKFTPENRAGSAFVDTTMIGSNGKFVR